VAKLNGVAHAGDARIAAMIITGIAITGVIAGLITLRTLPGRVERSLPSEPARATTGYVDLSARLALDRTDTIQPFPTSGPPTPCGACCHRARPSSRSAWRT
jgi:hypothetical protein